MKIKADFHNHPEGNFGQVVDIATRNLENGILGYINTAKTTHYEEFLKTIDYDVRNLKNAIETKQGLSIIRGQEIPTILSDGKIGEIVILGLKENLPINQKLEETLIRAQGEGGRIYGPHLFLPDSIGEELKRNPKLMGYFDALEVYNSQAGLFDGLKFFNPNKKAQEFYDEFIKKDLDIGAFSSTDRGGIGRSYSMVNSLDLKDSDTLLDSLKKELRNHKDISLDQQTPLRLAALMHSAKVLTFDKVLANIPYLNDWLKKKELIH